MTRVRRKREEHVRAPVRPTTPPELRQALGVGEKGQREEFARKILQDVMAEESRRSSRSSRREDVQRSESAMSYYGHEQSLSMESLHLRNIDSARSHPDFRSSSPLAMSQRPHTSRTVAVSFYDEKLEVEDQDPSHMDDEFFITSTKFHEEQSQQPNSHLSAPQHEHHDGANHLQHRPLPSVVKELLPHYMDQTPTGRQEAALKSCSELSNKLESEIIRSSQQDTQEQQSLRFRISKSRQQLDNESKHLERSIDVSHGRIAIYPASAAASRVNYESGLSWAPTSIPWRKDPLSGEWIRVDKQSFWGGGYHVARPRTTDEPFVQLDANSVKTIVNPVLRHIRPPKRLEEKERSLRSKVGGGFGMSAVASLGDPRPTPSRPALERGLFLLPQ
ncbi:hypothetical protein GUITHDRAFT_141042 [Guillardia theta CCMP2712]|uniref:Uncharacterized protein n=1 Tax=Guillardia theta (strain CCMP2712) TaxID=905079 RepID=L1J2S2_GUITC|nr:hypothetical protein GUITHDRAFT_141042 [Guillardia theta CCMP2712]EKX42622.1 hypothetical protein GUITHDRAFT_141042 [Guillardia theta CCMP2712]|eukprot:XP_005829602.1 hypothetical protein GUITHDRAFT_141042 [Guillardia theta CCMP2712]